MAISNKVREGMKQSSWIRRMFEEAERVKREQGEGAVFDLSLGNPYPEPPLRFLESLRTEVSGPALGTHRYMSNAGYAQTRACVAELVSQEQGVPVTEAQIVMSCGAAGALNVVLKALLDPGDEVIVFAPFFVEYLFYVDNHGGVPRIVETDTDFQPDIAQLRAAVTEKTKAVIINNPNNPTGVIYPEAAMRSIAGVLSEKSAGFGRPIYLISDEVYRHIVYDGIVVPSVFSEYSNSIIVTSFSKDLGIAGERIGYIAISPKLDARDELFAACATVTRTLGFVNAPALMQRSIRTCLDARVDLGLYRDNRKVLCEALSSAGFRVVKPLGAFYIFPQCPEPDDVACCASLRERGVFVVPGSGFGRSGYVRLSYSVSREVAMGAAARLVKLA